MPRWNPIIRGLFAVCLLISLVGLGQPVAAQAPSWQVIGGGDFSTGTVLDPHMALDPTTLLPVTAYQDSAFSGSRAKRFDGAAWQSLNGSVSFGTGWYHVLAFGFPPSSTVRAPFCFMRDYGNPYGDGTLSYYSPSLQTWVRANAAASVNGSHDVWIDLNTANPASPYYNVPVVSLADRDFNPTVANPPLNVNADGMTVKKYSFSTGAFQTIGNGGFDTNVTATTVRVTNSGSIIASYIRSQHANVRSFDPATNTWVRLGPANFSNYNSGGTPITAINNLSMVLDRNEIPWVAFMFATTQVYVMKYDPATNTWQQVGGRANGTPNGSLPQEAWRYRVPLAFDSANRPYVFYSVYAPATAAQDAKGVVRRFNGTAWELVGSLGFTPGGASYHSMEIDPYDAIYCGFRNMLTDKPMAMKFPSPCLAPPTITTQPTNTAACAGAPVSFAIAVSGTGVTYQWRKEGSNIGGATAATYVIAAPAAGDAGSYDVVVTNGCGSVTSTAASLTVNTAATITTQPGNLTVCEGAPASLTVAASGTAPLTYQWRKGGSNIGGATAATYTIPAPAAGDAGSYDVVVSNACGSTTSAAASLTVNVAAAITTQPASQTVCPGAPVTFAVGASGTAPTYQWRKGGSSISGATAATYVIPASAAGDAGAYDVIVESGCGSVTSAAAILAVDAAPTITTQPKSQTVCPGASVTLTVGASGTAPAYQWRKDGSNIGGATSATYAIPAPAAGDAGIYDAVISNACGSTTSAAATLAVDAAPTITTEPASQTVCPGASVTFTVGAAGTLPSYQWRKDGADIGGATAATYAIPAPAAGDAGTYDVVVSNACGSTTSAAASLTVSIAATITSQPASVTVCEGAAATFTVSASGTAPLTYQWRKGGSDIGGATAATYTIPAPAAGDAGTYDVVVSNGCGSVTSATATLAVDAAPTIATPPANLTVCESAAASFTVAASGTAPLTYQWRKGGSDIGGATAATYTIPAPAAGDAGTYDVVVSNGCGSVTSAAATLAVDTAPTITTQPGDLTACEGAPASLTVVASGGGLAYQWRKDGSDIGGATAETYAIPAPAAGDAGTYDVVVSNGCGSVTSTAAILTVDVAPTITTQPGDLAVCEGAPASLTIVASGTAPLTYQWRKDGSDIDGATAETYAIPTSAAGDAGAYDVIVTNGCESVTSAAATLTIDTPVTITSQPGDLTVCEGASASLTVVASGGGLAYQWRKDGSDIGGATAATYTIPVPAAGDAGNYDVVVTNACGSVTSTAASLTVNIAATIATPPANLTVCESAAASFTVAASGTAPLTYQWRKGGSDIGGATAATYTIPAPAAGDAGSYDVVVSNACGSTTSAAATLTIDTPVTITSQPGDLTVCEGAPAKLTVAASGTAPLTYQWRKGGSDIAGATGATHAIPAPAAGDSGSYDVVVTNGCGSVTSAAAILTVDVAPTITTQPADVTVCEGAAASLTVSASGAAPLTYQWRKGGSDIGGATAATYTIPAPAAGDAGSYDVVITNACGSVTSAAATLAVDAAPTIATPPANLTVCESAAASFTVAASGTAPLTYQWRKGGSDIGGATAATYTIPAPAAGDAGTYDVVVSNGCGSVTSATATLAVDAAPTIATPPANLTVCESAAASFTVAASGTAPLSYQWRKGGSDIGGATAATYTIPAPAAGDAGSYDVVVSNGCGSVTSATATLAVDTAPTITTQPGDLTVCESAAASFTVAASGTAPLTYQWRKGGSDIGGATAATYTIPAPAAGDAGSYDVVVSNACGSTTSAAATLAVDTAPTITTQPGDLTACEGAPASLTVVASGGGLAYQWRKDGSDIGGATAETYAIPAPAAGDAGTYDVVVSNGCGSVTSTAAILTVDVAPTITTQPGDLAVCEGAPASLTIVASGTAPLTYQWRKDGSDIDGATAETYAIPTSAAGDAGAYDVIVTNGCESVTSAAATLTIDTPVTITSQPGDLTVCEGASASLTVVASGGGLAYQWRKDGSDIGGATAATYTIPVPAAGDAGSYDVVVTNACGSVTSTAASLTVNIAATIATPPANLTVCESAAASFTVAASGTAPLTYQWRKGGSDIGGATAATYTIPAPAAGDAGSYDVVVSNACGSTTSAAATLTIDTPVTITSQPGDLTVCEGAPAKLTVAASGTAPLTYQWRKGGSDIAGATGATHAIPAPAAGDSGSYDVVVTNGCGSVTSAAAILTVDVAPTITTPPANITVCESAAATFTVSASGAAPLTYQWRKGGSDIGGATAATYTIPAPAAGDAGSYDVVVTNACGSATSVAASLTVGGPISITVQPAGQSACSGDPVSLSVTATGTAPVTYQWRKNGADVPGETSPVLMIPIPSTSDSGSYDVVVTDLCGSLASDVVTVSVALPLISTLNPPSIAPLGPTAPDVAITVNGSCFVPASVVYANGVALGTTFVSPTSLSCVIGPAVPQTQIPGGICVNVQNTIGDVSNSAALVVGSGSNVGTLRRQPLAPSPGDTYAIVMEGAPPFAVFSLFADLGTVNPLPGFPDPVTDLVLAVSPFTGSAGPFLIVFDGLGVFGPPTGISYDGTGTFVIPGIVLPNPPLGLAVTIQAAYLDPTSPIGLRLTWAKFPEQL